MGTSRSGEVPKLGIKTPVEVTATSNITLNGIGQTILGVVIAENDRIAATAQTDTTENGIWIAKPLQNWERASDCNHASDVLSGQIMMDVPTNVLWYITSPSFWVPGTGVLTFAVLVASGDVDWTVSQSPAVIHADNYTDTDTVYSHPNHSGDVTSVADGAQTIGAKKVTAAMMEDGTDGELFTWDTAGVLAKVAVGTNGQFLQSNGAGLAPTFEDVGVSSANNTWCTGYTFTFVDTDTFKITGFDVTNLFSAARRLKFSVGGADLFGAITSSSFAASDTTIEVTMESGVLADVAYEVCFVAGNTSWSPIATDPFSGVAINSIATGAIGATQYWIIVGDAGNVASSTDGGITWTLATITTTVDLQHVAYDSGHEYFFGGGDDGVTLWSSNGTTWTEDTTSIGTLGGTSTDHIMGAAYNDGDDVWALAYQDTGTNIHVASSIDLGVTWLDQPATDTGMTTGTPPENQIQDIDNTAGTDSFLAVCGGLTVTRIIINLADTSWADNDNAGEAITAMLTFWDTTNSVAVRLNGTGSGLIQGAVGWTGDDSTTISQKIMGMAHSQVYDRVVAVGDNGMVAYWDEADKASANAWTLVTNGFSPAVKINAVAWNVTDGNFVAVAADGVICRSTNGTN